MGAGYRVGSKPILGGTEHVTSLKRLGCYVKRVMESSKFGVFRLGGAMGGSDFEHQAILRSLADSV